MLKNSTTDKNKENKIIICVNHSDLNPLTLHINLSRILLINKFLQEWIHIPYTILQSALPIHQYIMAFFYFKRLGMSF